MNYCSFAYMKMLLAGALLLEEVANTWGGEGIDAIIDAAKKRFGESQLEKAAGSTVWWRVSKECVCMCMLLVLKSSFNRVCQRHALWFLLVLLFKKK